MLQSTVKFEDPQLRFNLQICSTLEIRKITLFGYAAISHMICNRWSKLQQKHRQHLQIGN